MLVVDASVLIQLLRGDRGCLRFLEGRLRHGPVLVPAVAAWELWRGAPSPRARLAVGQLLARLTVDPMTASIAQLAGELDVAHRSKGRAKPALDLLICAHALHHDADFATLDGDYDGIAMLRVVRPG